MRWIRWRSFWIRCWQVNGKAFSISGLAAYLKKWYIHLDQVLFIIKDDFK